MKIILAEKERQIFQKLIECVAHFNMSVTLRVAGGWVRDKVREF